MALTGQALFLQFCQRFYFQMVMEFLLPTYPLYRLRTEYRQANEKPGPKALKYGSSNGEEMPPASQGNL